MPGALAREAADAAAIAFVIVLSPLAAVTLPSRYGHRDRRRQPRVLIAGQPAQTRADEANRARGGGSSTRTTAPLFTKPPGPMAGDRSSSKPLFTRRRPILRPRQRCCQILAPYSLRNRIVAASGRADGIDVTLDGRVVNLETVNVLFNRLHDQGVRTGLVGWAVPYCHVFGSVLDQCRQLDHGIVFRRPSSLSGRMARQFQNLMPWYGKQSFIEMVRESVDLSERMVADNLLDVVWLHLPGPHLPVFYDRAARDYTMFKFDPARGYFDNLAWVDDTLGRLRAAMEQAGVWDQTSVILTSDHSWAAAILPDGRRDPRVPMLVKLARAHHPLADEKPFNTMAMIDIIQQLLRQDTATYADVVRWLHGSDVSGLAPLPGS